MAEMVVVSEEIESKIKLLFSKPSTPYSTSVTMQPLSASGRLTIFQHSAHIAPGREGLFNLIKSIPPTLKYEPERSWPKKTQQHRRKKQATESIIAKYLAAKAGK